MCQNFGKYLVMQEKIHPNEASNCRGWFDLVSNILQRKELDQFMIFAGGPGIRGMSCYSRTRNQNQRKQQ